MSNTLYRSASSEANRVDAKNSTSTSADSGALKTEIARATHGKDLKVWGNGCPPDRATVAGNRDGAADYWKAGGAKKGVVLLTRVVGAQLTVLLATGEEMLQFTGIVVLISVHRREATSSNSSLHPPVNVVDVVSICRR